MGYVKSEHMHLPVFISKNNVAYLSVLEFAVSARDVPLLKYE